MAGRMQLIVVSLVLLVAPDTGAGASTDGKKFVRVTAVREDETLPPGLPYREIGYLLTWTVPEPQAPALGDLFSAEMP